MKLWWSTGAVMFDSDQVVGGCLVDLPAAGYDGSANLVKTYPQYAGLTAWATSLTGDLVASVDYALGYPRVTMPRSSPGEPTGRYLVFVA
ncbi:hypothetical protein ACFJGW_00540 [Burkholderiaceae bacterium UC74_6]